MKRLVKNALLACGILAVVTFGAWTYFFAGPFRFIEHPIREPSIASIKPGATPVEATHNYLHGAWSSSDRPKWEDLSINVDETGEDLAVVTMINRRVLDDSVFKRCDRLTLQRRNGLWTPVRHQAAWQGRGRIGWTTRPTF